MANTASSIPEPEITDQTNFHLVLGHLDLRSTAYSTSFLPEISVRGAGKLGTKESRITAKVLVEKPVSTMLYPFHQRFKMKNHFGGGQTILSIAIANSKRGIRPGHIWNKRREELEESEEKRWPETEEGCGE